MFEAKTQTMRSTDPTHVDVPNVLIVAEEEWISGICVSDPIPTTLRKIEAGCASCQPATAVCAGNVQRANPEITKVEIWRVLSPKLLPRASDVCIENDGGRQGIGASEPYVLDFRW